MLQHKKLITRGKINEFYCVSIHLNYDGCNKKKAQA